MERVPCIQADPGDLILTGSDGQKLRKVSGLRLLRLEEQATRPAPALCPNLVALDSGYAKIFNDINGGLGPCGVNFGVPPQLIVYPKWPVKKGLRLVTFHLTAQLFGRVNVRRTGQ